MDRDRQDEQDLALVRRIAAGETAAIGELYDRYGRALLALSVRIVGDRETAEEVVQESFVRVWRNIASFDATRGRFASWLLTICHNLALNELRRRRGRPAETVQREETPAFDPAAEGPGPEEITWMSYQRTQVRAALATLPPPQREAIELAYYGGLTQVEIATRLGEPLGTVKTRVRLGMQKLAELLAGEFQEPKRS